MNNMHQSSRLNLDGFTCNPFELFENLNVNNENKFDKLLEIFKNPKYLNYIFHRKMLTIYKPRLFQEFMTKLIRNLP